MGVERYVLIQAYSKFVNSKRIIVCFMIDFVNNKYLDSLEH